MVNKLGIMLTFGGGGIGIVLADLIGPFHRLNWLVVVGGCEVAGFDLGRGLQ